MLFGCLFKKIVTTKDSLMSWYNESDVLIINVFDFLLNPDSLEI